VPKHLQVESGFLEEVSSFETGEYETIKRTVMVEAQRKRAKFEDSVDRILQHLDTKLAASASAAAEEDSDCRMEKISTWS
jgi:hypothetical protein